MSNPYQLRRRPGMNTRVALAISLLSLLVLAFVGPTAHAQTNSPGGGQPTDSSPGPAQGGVSNQSGTNTGSDGQAGNRSTPGQGGATGGGAGAPAGDDGGGGGSSIIGIVVIAALALIGAGIFVSSRQRRLERVEAT
jgi:uncharacterized membrane protein